MTEKIYIWIRNIAVFYIITTAMVQILPSEKYEKYIRFFMGILMIVMLCAPMLEILGNGRAFAEAFYNNVLKEQNIQRLETEKDMQQIWLNDKYEKEIQQELQKLLIEKNIKLERIKLNLQDSQMFFHIYLDEKPSEIIHERVLRELEAYGIKEADCRIEYSGNER